MSSGSGAFDFRRTEPGAGSVAWPRVLTSGRRIPSFPATLQPARPRVPELRAMKVRNSLKSLRSRHRNNRLVRRKGRVYVINKVQRRFKARQG